MTITQENQVEVVVRFGRSGLFPHRLKVGTAVYDIIRLDLVHSIVDGAVRIYFFSVSDGANHWKLGFNTQTLLWWVEDFDTVS